MSEKEEKYLAHEEEGAKAVEARTQEWKRKQAYIWIRFSYLLQNASSHDLNYNYISNLCATRASSFHRINKALFYTFILPKLRSLDT